MKIEFFPDVGRLFDVIVNFHFETFTQVVSIGKDFESLDVSVFFDILRLDVGDKISDAINVISEAETAESFNQYNADGFFIIGRSNVSKAHS